MTGWGSDTKAYEMETYEPEEELSEEDMITDYDKAKAKKSKKKAKKNFGNVHDSIPRQMTAKEMMERWKK